MPPSALPVAYQERVAPSASRLQRLRRAIRGRLTRLPAPDRAEFIHDVSVACERLVTLDDLAMKRERDDLRARLRADGIDEALIIRVFALVSAIATRRTQIRYSVTQWTAARIALDGRLAELTPGVDTSVAATLSACAVALAATPVHVVVSTDFRARRLAESLSVIYHALGLTVGVVLRDMPAPARAAAYRCDVTYGTTRELASDYLLDQQALGADTTRESAFLARLGGAVRPDRFLLRGLHFAIVDDADRVLLDDASEPIAVSGQERAGGGGERERTAISAPAFFARYLRLGGLSWTAREAAAELRAFYGLEVEGSEPLGEDRPAAAGRIRGSADAKWSALMRRIAELHGAGRPVLVACATSVDVQKVAELLDATSLSHANAAIVADRARLDLFARAGDAGAITLTTTSILTAGDVPSRSDIAVVMTGFSDSRRSERRLLAWSGASAGEMFASVDDELLKRYADLRDRGRARAAASAEGILDARTLSRIQHRAEVAAKHARRKRWRSAETTYDRALVATPRVVGWRATRERR